jgi:hypothetical protein
MSPETINHNECDVHGSVVFLRVGDNLELRIKKNKEYIKSISGLTLN